MASKVLFALSLNFFNAVFNRISTRLQELASSNEENPDYSDIELIQHINLDVHRLNKLLNGSKILIFISIKFSLFNLNKFITEAIQKFRSLKKSAHLVLLNSLEKAVWNWMDTYPHEFAELQRRPNEELSKACGELFDILDAFADNKKTRASAVWPLQIMLLLIISPKDLEEIVSADSSAPCSPKFMKKKSFIETVKKSLLIHGSSNRQLAEAAASTCVKLCKASTYICNLDSSNVIFTLVKHVISDLTLLLFNPNKLFLRTQNYTAQDIDLMIDCFVSCFRIKSHVTQVFAVCLDVKSPTIYQFVLVSSLFK